MKDGFENHDGTTPVCVPYVVFRDTQAHNRWTVRTLTIALIVAIVLMFASNAIWAYIWYQYDTVTEETVTTVDSEGDGVASFIGGDVDTNGGVVIGESDGKEDNADAN